MPQDELEQAGLSDSDIYAGKVTDKWRSFMKNQIKRARMFFDEAEKGVTELSEASRWPVSLTCFSTKYGTNAHKDMMSYMILIDHSRIIIVCPIHHLRCLHGIWNSPKL